MTPLTGTITFADEGTTGTGTGTSFTTQLRVGDEFQTADENILNEDAGGGIIFEDDERLEHESPTIADLASGIIYPEMADLRIEDVRWFIASEDSTVAAHSTHTNVLGQYSGWDTSQETFHILTDESFGMSRIEHETVTLADVQNEEISADVRAMKIEDFRWWMAGEDTRTPLHGSNDGIRLETGDRLEHEAVTATDVASFALTTEILELQWNKFHWLITKEDTAVASHSTHTNVIGAYELNDDSHVGVTGEYHNRWNGFVLTPEVERLQSGTTDASPYVERNFDENDLETYWINTEVSNASTGNDSVGQEDASGGFLQDKLDRDNNMIWEDFSKQLITEPQAFIVGAIANTTSLTVTRKHLGGTDNSEYLM